MKTFLFNYPIDFDEVSKKAKQYLPCMGLNGMNVMGNTIGYAASFKLDNVSLISSSTKVAILLHNNNTTKFSMIEISSVSLGENILSDVGYLKIEIRENDKWHFEKTDNFAIIDFFRGSTISKIDFYGYNMKEEIWEDEDDRNYQRADYYCEADFVHTIVFHLDQNRYVRFFGGTRGEEGISISFFNEKEYNGNFLPMIKDEINIVGLKYYNLVGSIASE